MLGVSRRHEILYNLGIQLLFSGRPIVAFDCLVEAVQIYHTNPRLWLRLAECCIVAFQLVSGLPLYYLSSNQMEPDNACNVTLLLNCFHVTS